MLGALRKARRFMRGFHWRVRLNGHGKRRAVSLQRAISKLLGSRVNQRLPAVAGPVHPVGPLVRSTAAAFPGHEPATVNPPAAADRVAGLGRPEPRGNPRPLPPGHLRAERPLLRAGLPAGRMRRAPGRRGPAPAASPRAVRLAGARAFLKARTEPAACRALPERLATIDRVLTAHDSALRDLYRKLRPLLRPGASHVPVCPPPAPGR